MTQMDNITPASPEQFERAPLYVEGVQVTATNFLAVAKWCEGNIQKTDDKSTVTDFAGFDPNESFIKVDVRNPKDGRETRAYVGDYVVKYPVAGFKVLKANHFNKTFVPRYKTTAELAEEMSATPVVSPAGMKNPRTWDPEKAGDLFPQPGMVDALRGEDTEKVGESAVPSDLATSAPHGEHSKGGLSEETVHATAGAEVPEGVVDHAENTVDKLKAAAEAGGHPTSDEPLPEMDLQTALELTGVKTEMSRVCDLAVGSDFVYQGILYSVDSKSDTKLIAKKMSDPTESVVKYMVFALPGDGQTQYEESDTFVSWYIEVLTDVPDSAKKLSVPLRPTEPGYNELVSAIEREKVSGIAESNRVVHEAQPTEVADGYEKAPKPIDEPGSVV